MRIQAAVAWEAGAPLSIEEFDLDEPRDDEILVRIEAVGVCHTDDNARLGRLPVVFPIILGHEGAGVERAGAILNAMPVGPGRTAAVFGTGAVGLAAVMAARASGADEIIAIDRVQHRLRLARTWRT